MARRILVTGGNTGIGFALCMQLATEHGCHVLLGARNAAKGAVAVESIKKDAPEAHVELVLIDTSSDESVAAAAEAVRGGGGDALYAIVNNAGTGLAHGVDAATVLSTNLLGPKRVCEAFGPLLDAAGRIVNVGSGAGPMFVARAPPALQVRRNARAPQVSSALVGAGRTLSRPFAQRNVSGLSALVVAGRRLSRPFAQRNVTGLSALVVAGRRLSRPFAQRNVSGLSALVVAGRRLSRPFAQRNVTGLSALVVAGRRRLSRPLRAAERNRPRVWLQALLCDGGAPHVTWAVLEAAARDGLAADSMGGYGVSKACLAAYTALLAREAREDLLASSPLDRHCQHRAARSREAREAPRGCARSGCGRPAAFRSMSALPPQTTTTTASPSVYTTTAASPSAWNVRSGRRSSGDGDGSIPAASTAAATPSPSRRPI